MRVHPHSGQCFGGFMAFTRDKIPDVVKAYRNLEPFRSDMALIVGIGAPEKTVNSFQTLLT